MIRSILALATCLALGGCTMPGITLATSLIGAGASGYTLATRISEDAAAGLVAQCRVWKTGTRSAGDPKGERAAAVLSFGDEACEQVAAGNPPPGSPIATAMWLAAVEGQYRAVQQVAP
jgi:hypothetical protein